MRRTWTLTTGMLVVGIGVAAVAGCSSDGKSTTDTSGSATSAQPSASASAGTASGTAGGTGSGATPAPTTTAPAGKGHLDYSGDRSGGFDAKGTTCVIASGRLIAVTMPDAKQLKDGAAPGFTATLTGATSAATLITADKHTYVRTEATGVRGRKAGDAWVVFVNNTKLDADGGGSITVNGTLSCTHTTGV